MIKKIGRGILWIISAFCLGIISQLFVLSFYAIPSPSMEKTLLPGDIILVNKLRYGLRLPNSWAEVPFATLVVDEPEKAWSEQSPALLQYAAIQRGDVIVFKRETYEKRMVKRCIGMPGERLAIHGDSILINEQLLVDTFPGKARFNTAQNQSVNQSFENPAHIFPHHLKYPWSSTQFGPLWIPKKGESLSLNEDNIHLYWEVIQKFEQQKIRLKEGQIWIDGQVQDQYIFQQDYYFVLGDNRTYSRDSRYFGFIPASSIQGKASLIISSTNPRNNKSRSERFFKWIK